MGVIIKNYIKNLKNEKITLYIYWISSYYIYLRRSYIRGKMFEDYRDTRSRLFAIVCVAIWIGLFNLST